jgi:sensor histidine kinase YesM
MEKILKTIAIFLMIGMMGIGFGTSVIEASPLIQQLDDQEQVRHNAELTENERHDQAMERRANESESEWYQRQRLENERHTRKLWLISHAIVF